MDTKLTLKINEDVIEKAKEYAKAKKTSLSDLIENYLQKLTNNKKSKKDITPLVKSLSGVISLPKDYNEKKDYTDYLINKYK
jgi:predicted CopG family antitoxin